MTSLLERAIEKVRTLPSDSQDDLARMLLQAIGEPLPAVDLKVEDEAAVMRSREVAARGGFATDDDMRQLWTKYGQ